MWPSTTVSTQQQQQARIASSSFTQQITPRHTALTAAVTLSAVLCCRCGLPVHVDLSPSAIAMLDTAYLGLLSVYGQFPRSIKSVLFTGLVYGLPAVLRFAGLEEQLPAIQNFPKYASRLGLAYSAISTLAIALVVLACVPVCYKLLQSDAVQDAVQSVVDSGKQSQQQQQQSSGGKGVGRGESGRGYEAEEDEDGDEEEGDDGAAEDDEEAEPVKQQRPQVRSTRQGKVRQ